VRRGDVAFDALVDDSFNQAAGGRPRAVVLAESAGDVQATVRTAAGEGAGVAVRATGHGPSVPLEGAYLILTRRLDQVHVDVEARTATVAAGVCTQAVLDTADPHDLTPIAGSNPGVGLVGYTLGGGMGLLGRRFGFAADRVHSMDVVTGDGELRRVTSDADPALFWGLRASRDNLGIVVAMTFGLVEVPPLLGGGLFFDAPDAAAVADVLRRWVDWTHSVPEAMSSSILVAAFPEGAPGVPEPVGGRTAVHVRIAHAGDPREGRRLVRALEREGAALANTVRPMRPRDGASIHNEPPGPVSAYDRSLLLDDLEVHGLDALAGALHDPTAIPLVVEVRHLGGAFARRAPNAAPIAARDAAYSLYTASVIEAGMAVEDLRARHDAMHQPLRPHALRGGFLSFLGIGDTSPEQVATAFDPDDLARLRTLKRRYDPHDLFRFNHHISPSAD